MKFQHRIPVQTSPDWLWDYVTEIPNVVSCIPWISDLRQVGDNAYEAKVKIAVGPISLSMDGKLIVEDLRPEERVGILRAEATDRKAAGRVHARIIVRLEPRDSHTTDLIVDTEATIAGKIGEFGQPILHRKADSMMHEFAKNLAIRAAQQKC